MKISELYGKTVESTTGKHGYVVSVNAYGNELQCLICADADENLFTVDIKNVLSVEPKIVYEDRESVIKAATPVRLGRAGFDESGTYLGSLQDFSVKDYKLVSAKIGKKNYPAKGLVSGDIIIVKKPKTLKADVIKGGKIILRRGSTLTEDALDRAADEGEYVQANLKSL